MSNRKNKKENLFSGIVNEFKIITWPKSKEFKITTGIVLIFVFLYIVYIGFFDLILKKVFDLLFK